MARLLYEADNFGWVDVALVNKTTPTLTEQLARYEIVGAQQIIVVLLSVLFRKLGLEHQATLGWEMLAIPIGIVAIDAAIKLIGLDH